MSCPVGGAVSAASREPPRVCVLPEPGPSWKLERDLAIL